MPLLQVLSSKGATDFTAASGMRINAQNQVRKKEGQLPVLK
jgi:hypothetical protein